MDNKRAENDTSKDNQEPSTETSNKTIKEIDRLKEESEMPIEELMKLYSNKEPASGKVRIEIEEVEEVEEDDDEEEDYSDDEDGNDYYEDENEEIKSKSDEEVVNSVENAKNFESNNKKRKRNASELLKLMTNNADYSEFEESDEDFDPDNYSKKRIKIGDEYQAEIRSNEESKDLSILCWSPYRLHEDEVVEFLKKLGQNSLKYVEDELALTILNLCDYQIERALEKYDKEKYLKSLKWSEDQTLAFEEGLKTHGKIFSKIKEEFLNELSVREIVEFYYLWKKSERYDVFVSKYSIKKKNGFLNANVTDFMEKFIMERQETLKQGDQVAKPEQQL